jgi:gliding motility-associated-like protein
LDCVLNEPNQLSVSFDADLLVGCSPITVQFQNTSDPSVSCLWSFGDGNSFVGCNDVINTYEQGGLFDVYLVIVDANGCTNNITYNDFITVYQTPFADFSVNPQQLFPDSQTATITNLSTGGDWYIWNLGDETSNHLYFEPGEHTYPINIADTFLITLYASTTEGCSDTAIQIILFNNDPFYYAPNTFIPDDDGTNDIWMPVFSNSANIQKYSLQIFNRWGELIFETNNPSVGWDGTMNNGAIKAQDGTYVWNLQFTWKDYKVYPATGHVNLLR